MLVSTTVSMAGRQCYSDRTLNNDAGYHMLIKQTFDRLFDYTISISAGMIIYRIQHSTKGLIDVCQYVDVCPGAFRFVLRVNNKAYFLVNFYGLLNQLTN